MSSDEMETIYEDPLDSSELIDHLTITEEEAEESIIQFMGWIDNKSDTNPIDLDLLTESLQKDFTADDISKVLDILDRHSTPNINGNLLNTSSTVTNVVKKSSKTKKKSQKSETKSGKQLRFLIQKFREEGVIMKDLSKTRLNGQIIGNLRDKILTRSQSRLKTNEINDKSNNSDINNRKSDDSSKRQRFSTPITTTITRTDDSVDDLANNFITKDSVRILCRYFNGCPKCGKKGGICVVDCGQNQFTSVLPYVSAERLDPKLIQELTSSPKRKKSTDKNPISLLNANIAKKSPKNVRKSRVQSLDSRFSQLIAHLEKQPPTEPLRLWIESLRVRSLDSGNSRLKANFKKKSAKERLKSRFGSQKVVPKVVPKVCKFCNPLKRKRKSRVVSKFLYSVFTKTKSKSRSRIPIRIKTNGSWSSCLDECIDNIYRKHKK